MNFKISNVCNINDANISIVKNELNIKYGNNGIGKTSMAKAIDLTIKGKSLDELVRFGSDKKPSVEFDNKPTSCIVFDGNYVDNYLYENDDLLNDTYNLIVKTKDFDERINEINNLLEKLKVSCKSTNIMKLRTDIETYNSEVQFNNNGELNNKSKFGKGFKNGVTINETIPSEIIEYENLIKSKFNFDWIKWVQQGSKYILDNKCPFCCKELDENNIVKIDKVSNFSSSTLMKDNFHSKEVIAKLAHYSEQTTGIKIDNINATKGNISLTDLKILKIVLSSFYREVEKIKSINLLDAVMIRNIISGDSLIELIKNFKIDLNLFNNLDNELYEDLKTINSEIDILIAKIDDLKLKLVELNKELSKNINSTKKFVNEFLKIAGIPYQVEVIAENSFQSRTILKSTECNVKIEQPKNRLSYGEKNAISLVLFAVEVKNKLHELIILDDPISSFDSNKKFALMYYLFSSDNAIFKNKTILMFTHDFNPIIDFIKLDCYKNAKANACLLLNNNGDISETVISKEHILNTINVEMELSKDDSISKISRVTHLRRHYELSNCFSTEYEMLSSLLHLYPKPLKKISRDKFEEFTEEEIIKATSSIKKIIESFDYDAYYNEFNDNEKLKAEYNIATNFEKLNIVRVFINKNNGNHERDVCWKFICDTYHVENLTIFGLNSRNFDNIPEYIIKICDHIIL